ncbi:MAG: hypothetical protein ACLF0G_01150 [Candidatus Brocadiia bacterium]
MARRPLLRLAAACALLGAACARAGERDEEERPPTMALPLYGLVSAALEHPTRTELERAAALAETLNKTPVEQLTTDDVVKLYTEVPYQLVQELAEHGISVDGRRVQLAQDQAVQLAVLRDAMINAVYEEMARDYGMEFTRLDFGNKLSGVKSDVDHTAYAEDFAKLEAQGVDIRAEFERRFQARWQVAMEACDICIHSGKNSVPDWRGTEDVVAFDARMVEVLRGLAGTPDAYDTEGSWRMQVEQRSVKGAEAAQEAFERLRNFEREVEGADLTPDQQAELARLRQDAEGKNPCTSFKPDGQGGVQLSRDVHILRHLFQGVNTDVLRMYAFDAAVSNYLFHLHYDDKTVHTKYVLRSFEEGVSLLRPLPADEGLKPVDYMRLSPEQRDALIRELYPDTIEPLPGRPQTAAKGFNQLQRKQVRLVLDVAAALRQNHKLPPEKQRPASEIWRPLMDHLRQRSKAKHIADDDLMRAAKLEYNRASTEVLAWNNYRTARVRYVAWLEPKLLNEMDVQLLGKVAPGVTREKLQHSAFYALKRAFAYLPEAHVKRIIDDAPQRYRRDLETLRGIVRTEIARYGRINLDPATRKSIRQRLAEAADGVKRTWARKYDDFWHAVRNQHYTDEAITKRVWDEVYDFAGYEKKIVYDDFNADAPRLVERWSASKALGNLVTSGNISSALQVLQVYQKGGSRSEVIAAIVWEGMCNIPGVVHLVALRDATHGHWGGVHFVLSSAACNAIRKYAVEQGIGWAAPFGANILIYFTIAKTAVQIIGYEVFEPLTNDAADMMYTGRIGPPEPPEEFTDDDQTRLDSLERLLADKRERLIQPDLALDSPEGRKLIDEMRGLVRSARELKAKKTAWEQYQEAAQRWRAGILRAGWTEAREAQTFHPILGPDIELQFFVGSLDGDKGGPVDLRPKPLNAEELDQLDSLCRKLEGLRTESQGLALPQRIDQVARLMDQIDTLRERHAAGQRARRYLEKIRSDRTWAIEARRQNLFRHLDPLVRKHMEAGGQPPESQVPQMSEAQSEAYFGAKEQAAGKVVDRYVHQWFDREHPQTRSLAVHKEALKRIVPRMLADYRASEKLTQDLQEYFWAQEEARRARFEQRRQFLRTHAAKQGVNGFLEQGREAAADYGLLVATRRTPHMKPIIRLQGVVREEGEGEAQRRIHFRVKVIASPMQYPPPYRVVLRAKGAGEAAGGAKKRTLLADVLDAKGSRVGTVEVPVVLEKFAEKQQVAEAHEWVLPPKLLVSHSDRRSECFIRASLAGAPVGHHRLAVAVGGQSYTLFGQCERRGSVANFAGTVPLPNGPAKITLSMPGVPPESFTVERKPYVPKPGKLEAAQKRVAEARKSLAEADEAFKARWALAFAWACGGLATEYRGRGQYAEAVAVLGEGLDALPPPGSKQCTHSSEQWRRSALHSSIDAAWRAGDLGALMAATRRAIDTHKASARFRPTGRENPKAYLDHVISTIDSALPKILSLGGAAQAKALWAEKKKAEAEKSGPDPVPEPHPQWGPD